MTMSMIHLMIYRDAFDHKGIIKNLQENPQMIVINTTYHTKKYGLPLLKFVISTCIGIIIPIANFFLFWEREHNFQWSLSTLVKLYTEYSVD
ncbi:hypothetical protein OnM2_070065 [Erysiphe neolycopersici]|uniref:MULE transposase domain-containing protein n=1 Tax=Erysiphe neolycopersici TaxID=212602 RepID=A0A420HKX6_9PEZI|nr:hypothetical protein OnM2_070065 [Erysiphe neolycopersici]